MKITFEFPDYKETAIYDGINFRQKKIKEIIKYLKKMKVSLPLTVAANFPLNQDIRVLIERNPEGIS